MVNWKAGTARWWCLLAIATLIPIACVWITWWRGWLSVFPSVEISAAIPVIAFCLAWALFDAPPYRLSRINWRVQAILIPTFLSVAATLIGFAAGLHEPGWGFAKDVFAGWVGGVAFFGFVGLLIAIASLARPDDDPYDARVRVLVRGKTGPHIDDLTARLKSTLAHYAGRVTRTVTVERFDPASGMYLVQVGVKTVILSYVDDTETVYASAVSYKPDHPPPPGEAHRLVRLSGTRASEAPLAQTTADELRRDYVADVARENECVIDFDLRIWVKAGTEALNYRPVRFTRAVGLEIRNNLNRDLVLRIAWHKSTEQALTLKAGSPATTLEASEVPPDQLVHRIFFEP